MRFVFRFPLSLALLSVLACLPTSAQGADKKETKGEGDGGDKVVIYADIHGFAKWVGHETWIQKLKAKAKGMTIVEYAEPRAVIDRSEPGKGAAKLFNLLKKNDDASICVIFTNTYAATKDQNSSYANWIARATGAQLKHITTTYPEMRIILVTPPLINPAGLKSNKDGGQFAESSNEVLKGLATEYAALAQAEGYTLVNLQEQLEADDMNGMVPTEAGMEKVAGIILAALGGKGGGDAGQGGAETGEGEWTGVLKSVKNDKGRVEGATLTVGDKVHDLYYGFRVKRALKTLDGKTVTIEGEIRERRGELQLKAKDIEETAAKE